MTLRRHGGECVVVRAACVAVALDDVADWGAVLADALAQTGGKLSAEERRWADRVLGPGIGGTGSAA